MTDPQGAVCAPLPVAPVKETAMVLVPQGLHAVQPVAQPVGGDLTGAASPLASGLEAAPHRQGIVHAGLLPNSHEKPRNRTRPKRGRTRFFHAALEAWSIQVERTCAWEEKGKRRR